jgi:hypothetical protein
MMRKNLQAILLIFISATFLLGQKTFESKKFDFSMQEPKDWIIIEKSELIKNLEKLDFTEAELEQLIKNSKGSIPIIVYVKYDHTKKAGLIPKIQIDVRANNTKNFPQFKAALTQFTQSLKEVFEGFEFIQEPKEIEVSGIKSVMFIGRFAIKTQKGEELKVRSRVLAVPYKNYFFQVNLIDGQIEEDNAELFDKIIKTIKIGN